MSPLYIGSLTCIKRVWQDKHWRCFCDQRYKGSSQVSHYVKIKVAFPCSFPFRFVLGWSDRCGCGVRDAFKNFVSAISKPEVLTELVTHITMQSKQQQTEKNISKITIKFILSWIFLIAYSIFFWTVVVLIAF